MEKVKNEEGFRTAGKDRILLKQLERRKAQFIGHILRYDSLTERVIKGKMEGKHCKGRPRLEFMTQSMQDMNWLLRKVNNRKTTFGVCDSEYAGHEPVSYTHLDVYKRQGILSMIIEETQIYGRN